MARTRDLYLRALGVVFAIAFASWGWQQPGLIGSHGIAPAAEYLARARASSGSVSFFDLPTVLLWRDGDGALIGVCVTGFVYSLRLVAGMLPLPSLLVCWLLYLSLVTVGGPFMQFQWDSLLLEAGATALLVAPASRWLRRGREPHFAGVLLQRLLVFKLILLAGIVKLASGDTTWRDLSALSYHYWSQPLPTWTAWLADKLPAPLQSASVALMLAVELGAPLFVFAPRRLRIGLGFVPIAGLMVLIAATGNFGFFNLLTVVLCIPLLDDAALERIGRAWAALRRRPAPETEEMVARPLHPAARALRGTVMAAAALLILTVSVGQVGLRLGGAELPAWQHDLMARVAPFRSINSYGLFASMTTDRREIALEGSADGVTWTPYRFKWKPGPLAERPEFMSPHMPRLDWQMWFAALGDCNHNPWFIAFQRRLLEGSLPVAALLDSNPFPERPPRYLRTPLWRYRFTNWSDWRQRGEWWRRESIGEYCPILTLEGGKLQIASP